MQGLRASTVEVNDLAEAIAAIGADLTKAQQGAGAPVVGVAVDGPSRHLNPLARDEAWRIAGEALRNACRHADARHVNVTLQYGGRQFRMTIVDDGKGIEAATLAGQQPASHFGMSGMRERAAVIGGELDIRSTIGRGTEVELRVPAPNAYEGGALSWLGLDVFRRAGAPAEKADREGAST